MTQQTEFSNFNLAEPLLKALTQLNYNTPTPIQSQAIPHLLEGKDLLGCAQTGTGKTAAFALPLLTFAHHRWSPLQPKMAEALILTPTRELAVQIHQNVKDYGQFMKFRMAVVYGGVSMGPQVRDLEKGVDILIATPGRLLDLISQKKVSLAQLKVFVLDEADRMLDMGFINDIKKILGMIPQKRQSLFFSATMPNEIQKLANTILRSPVKVEVAPESTTAENVSQKLFYVDRSNKKELLKYVLKDPSTQKVILFTRTKHGANRVAEMLIKLNIPSLALHGDKSQNSRLAALEALKSGKIRVLVATDLAARGIDVDDVTHVINYEIPNLAESYVHRIGRTARAGRSGWAYSFCDAEEKAFIKDIERTTGQSIEIDRKQPFHSMEVEKAALISKGKAKEMIEKAQKMTGGKQLKIGYGSKRRFSGQNQKSGNKKRGFFKGKGK